MRISFHRSRRTATPRALILGLSIALASCDLITGPPPAPSAPSSLVAEAVTDVRIGLRWTLPDGDVSRLLLERMQGGGSFIALDVLDPTATTYQDSGLTGTTAYRYRLQACGAGGCSPYVEVDATTLAPLVLSAAAIPALTMGSPVQAALTVSGGPGSATIAVTAGALPTGLSLGGTGTLVGTPTALGTFTSTVLATAANGQSATLALTLTVKLATGPGSFRITTLEVSSLSSAVAAAVAKATARWESVIVGDLPDDSIPLGFFRASDCGGFGTRLNGRSVDDILVVVNVAPIDGAGSVLGEAGPCAFHEDGGLPGVGVLTLDTDDLAPLVGTETLTAIIFHEIGHILGFGTVWSELGLLTGGRTDPHFMGAAAAHEFEALGGSTGGVLVENQGGEGTAGGHWRETTFDSEVMTGFSERVGVPQPLSRVTIAAMGDIGYTVDLSAADPFTLPPPRVVQGAPEPALGWDEILTEPVRVLPR